MVGIADATQKLPQERSRKSGRQVLKVLKEIRTLLNYRCGSLAAILPEVVTSLEPRD